MRRLAMLAGVGVVEGAIVVYRCAGSRPESTDDSTGSNASRLMLLRAPAGTKIAIGVERGITATITLAPRQPPPDE